MSLLALDTSQRPIVLGLQGEKEVHTLHSTDSIGLFAACKDLISEISGIILCTGPGSFTGLRIGYAFVHGIINIRAVPVYGISKFDIVREHVSDKSVVYLPATTKDSYYKRYDLTGAEMEGVESVASTLPVTLTPETCIATMFALHPVKTVGLYNHLNLDAARSLTGPNYLKTLNYKKKAYYSYTFS